MIALVVRLVADPAPVPCPPESAACEPIKIPMAPKPIERRSRKRRIGCPHDEMLNTSSPASVPLHRNLRLTDWKSGRSQPTTGKATGTACVDRKSAGSCCPTPDRCAISAGTSQCGRTTRFRISRHTCGPFDGSSNRAVPGIREGPEDIRERGPGGSCNRARDRCPAAVAASTRGYKQALPPRAQSKVQTAKPRLQQCGNERRSCFPPCQVDRIELPLGRDVPPVAFPQLTDWKYHEARFMPFRQLPFAHRRLERPFNSWRDCATGRTR